MIAIFWLLAAVTVGILVDWRLGLAMWAVPAGFVFLFALGGVGLISGRRDHSGFALDPPRVRDSTKSHTRKLAGNPIAAGLPAPRGTKHRRWRPGEAVLLYRSEIEDQERLLDFEEERLAEIMKTSLSLEDFAKWQQEAPQRRADKRDDLTLRKRNLGRRDARR